MIKDKPGTKDQCCALGGRVTRGPLEAFATKADADKLNVTMTQVQGCKELWCLPCLELSITLPPTQNRAPETYMFQHILCLKHYHA